MMNGGMWVGGWMGGYAGMWMPVLVLSVVVARFERRHDRHL